MLIEFLHGDIDRPIAVAVIHNGRRPTAAFSGARGCRAIARSPAS
ncbi:hypothetical protein ACFQS6_16050 [Xanthomonas populi]